MKKACFIIPYYGKFPNYFPLWLNSARANPEFDFFFLTDIHHEFAVSENIKFVSITLAQFAQRVEEKLGLKPALDEAYKLCDFKPAYGFLFPEIVKDYPFWGFMDIDLIFGNLSKFLTDSLFEKYDKIGRQGHMTLFRNCDACNMLFMLPNDGKYPDYRTVFTNKYSYHFDESGQIADAEAYGVPCCSIGNYYDVMPHRFPFMVMLRGGGFGKSILEYINGTLELHYLESGELKKQELTYIHFQKRTMALESAVDLSHYLAVPNRFIQAAPINKEMIVKYNRDRIYWQWYRIRLKMIVDSIRNGALKERFI